MVRHDDSRIRLHRLSPQFIQDQAREIGIPLIQRETTWERYEQDLGEVVQELKKEEVSAIIFGDIDLEEHKCWDERFCDKFRVKPIFPLWQADPEGLVLEFIHSGFEAEVISAKENLADLLGEKLDLEFLSRVKEKGIHPCGENGEYHSVVTFGPIFNRRISITKTQKRHDGGYCFLDILEYKIGYSLEVKEGFTS
jgi:uncharacterized protein (TIGR00290 family)